MIDSEPTATEKSQQYKSLLKAARKSVVRVSAILAIIGVLKFGISGAVALYLYAAAASTYGMCIFLLVALPLIWNARCVLHPAFFSLVAMLVLGGCAYALGLVVGGNPLNLNKVQGAMILFGFLYGAPIGFYMRDQVTKPEQDAPVSGASVQA